MTSLLVILAYARIHFGKASELANLLVHLGKPKCFSEIANTEYRLNNYKMDSDGSQNESHKL
jgi:hypothetical protein